MKKTSNLDTVFKARLRQALEARLIQSSSDEATTDCVDEETVAAWADDALDARERAAVEAHAADCSRCQALLAAMVRTAPPVAEIKSSWWRATAVKLWVPLAAAAAAALVVWAIRPSRQPSVTTDRVAPLVALPSHASTPPSGQLQATASSRGAEAPPADLTQPVKPVPTTRNLREAAKAPASASASTDALAPAAAKADAPTAQPQVAASAPVPAAPLQLQTFARARRESGAVEEIVSANPTMRWRIVAGGAVQRSIDGGSTWQLQQTGADVILVAGASPSPMVCWLVGRSGVVLLQTDGSTWRRIGFPEQVDLASVQATDERTATVTTADGRPFKTTDGGLTWTLAR